MTKKVFALDTKPGVQRDGTVFDKQYYNSGRWVRFQRGRPRKVGGYREIVNDLAGPSRGMYLNPQQDFNNVFNGYSGGLQSLPISSTGVGSGVTDLTLTGFTANANNLWQFDTFYDVSGSGNNLLLAHPGQNLTLIDNNINTPVLGGAITGTSLSPIGVFTQVAATITSGSPNITLSSANIQIGAGQLVSGTGIPSGATVVSITTTALVISAPATANGSSITLTFNNNISVSGGVVTLHPYVFVYGNDGLIKNCSAGNANDWVSADANEVSVATGKIVQGLPVRGGSNAPSGLFWSLDSLIRVSYIGGVGTPPQFWRYDLISSQSSILSGQSVIEYDGVYYWCGVDRFLLYNGVVKEIPNTFNQNYFFDNLNYAQREKVWVTKVPRFGEIWWFYPRGNATECTDAVIYNVRENVWYDAGEALGAQRSAGYFSQVFHYPISSDWNLNASGGILTATITNAGSGYTNGTYNNTVLTGGSGSGATANIIIAGGVVTVVSINGHGTDYVVGDALSATITGGAGFVLTVASLMNFVSLFQDEVGTDKVIGPTALAIESYFETNDLGWVSGGPSQPAPVGDNKWLRLERVEPDFVQSGNMDLYVTGRPFAQSADQTSAAYTFGPNTNKIDMREQRRELRLKFVSNVAGGDYQLGRVILDADLGDVRPY
tara:strand:- start:10242 stop:12227 length:1986 start_codon:yes stop_codon:yes gene_type:complete